MQFVEESLRWEVFVLWIRAVVNAANGVPPVIEQELETRIPGFLARVREELESAEEVGERLWNLVGAWIATHVLLQPKVEGWLNAVNFFSSRTMTYIKVWGLSDIASCGTSGTFEHQRINLYTIGI